MKGRKRMRIDYRRYHAVIAGIDFCIDRAEGDDVHPLLPVAGSCFLGDCPYPIVAIRKTAALVLGGIVWYKGERAGPCLLSEDRVTELYPQYYITYRDLPDLFVFDARKTPYDVRHGSVVGWGYSLDDRLVDVASLESLKRDFVKGFADMSLREIWTMESYEDRRRRLVPKYVYTEL